MKLRRRNKFAAEVSTASLNDIMFFLMLFFLIVSTIAAPGLLKVALPKSGVPSVDTKPTVRMEISSDLQYSIDNQKVSGTDLPSRLSSTLSGKPESIISLNIDKNVAVEHLVNIYDLVMKYNKNNNANVRIVLATQPNK